ncbi:MAG TPA: flagellar filament capping protein FliD, partial [Pseudomonas sp.]|nr:flagellar filament capping protein FliD [Pseudomonas sp.]
MAGITGTGLGSGMKIDEIVTALVNAEKAPKAAQLDRLEKAAEAKISSLGSLKSALNDFQTALKDLNDLKLFNTRTATSSDTARVTAKAGENALAGKYSIEVLSLAKSSKIASGSVSGTSAATFATGGKLTIGQGSDSYSIDVADGASLKDVRDAINTQLKDKGISANIVTDPVDNSSQLVLSSSKTGAGNDLTLAVDDAGSDLQALVTGMPAALSTSENAKFKIDGLEVQSASNEVSDVIEGVTFNLLTAEEGKTATLTVGDNTGAVKTNLQKFVDSYNKLISTTTSLTSVVAVEGSEPLTGNLVGDATVRSLLSGIRSELVTPGAGDFRALSDLGITTDKTGKLVIDSDKLDKVLAEDYDKVGEFLTGDKGLLSRLNETVDGYSKSGGILEMRISAQQDMRKDVKDQREALDLRIAKVQDRLYAQYNAMDALVGQLRSTSDSIAST